MSSRRFPRSVRFRGFLLNVSRRDFPRSVRFIGFLLYVISRGDFLALSIVDDFCCMSVVEISLFCPFLRIFAVCHQSRRFPCSVHFGGFLLYVISRGDFPTLSILEDFC